MAGIRDVKSLKPAYYESGVEILRDFLLPTLSVSSNYDRVTGYFTVEALLAVAQGLDHLYACGGHMRLAVGIHDFPRDAAEAVANADSLRDRVQQIREELVSDIAKLSDALLKDRLATLALMIEDGFLSVKVVDTVNDKCIFHSKMLIMRDTRGDSVAAMGSLNETESGLGGNHENLMVIRSWVDNDAVRLQQEFFDKTWSGLLPDLIVQDLSKDLAKDIANGVGAERIQRLRLALKRQTSLADAANMPSYFFVSGTIPALYQHQERAVLDGLSRWPVRVLYADEVGLGKTFEVAATISYLMKYCGARRTVILTPKSVLTQWRDELYENFSIDAWCYDSAARQYVSHDGSAKHVLDGCPIGKDMPSVAIISAQYARGSGNRDDIFQMQGAILPDVLAVDEAHAARTSIDIGGKKKSTKLYQVLKRISAKVPHLILASATPMQKDSVEYLSLLNLIGLPGHWSREGAFEKSLSVVAASETPSLNELSTAAALLLEVLHEMKPSLDLLEPNERALLDKLNPCTDRLTMGLEASNAWELFRSAFIKLHPARLLTVRNTRRSLEEIGYVFPERKLKAETLYGHDDIKYLYNEINEYIASTYLGVERALYPNRKFSDGFVKSSYQQRVASSLYSCEKSLQRRLEKLNQLGRLLDKKRAADWVMPLDLSDEDEDEALLSGTEVEGVETALAFADASQVERALNTELTELIPLVRQLSIVRTESGDPKIDRSIDLVLERIASGSQVLVFSRYTDTVDALLERWKQVAHDGLAYGVYTGDGAVVVQQGITRQSSKDEIKKLLNEGVLSVMFCSDAASEGLNLQAARILINVDVPWTPARLEQRIGRVARLGQRSATVEIINVWYPNSVEERMYTRLNQRLREYDLAVGEFPDVVADSIRRSILEPGIDDDSVQMLQDIRNSLQTKALQALWAHGAPGETSSQMFRSKLLHDIESIAPCERIDDRTVSVRFPDGTRDVVSSHEGDGKAISLSSRCVLEYYSHINGFRTLNDEDGRHCAFACEEGLLQPEMMPSLLAGTGNRASLCSPNRPKWLPNNANLSLGYAVEREQPQPRCWPPMKREDG